MRPYRPDLTLFDLAVALWEEERSAGH
jgi:hypothetical protein